MNLRDQEKRLPDPSLMDAILDAKWLVLIIAVAAGVAGFLYSTGRPRIYLGSTILHLSYAEGGADAPRDPERRLRDEAQRVISRPVLERAASRLPKATIGMDDLIANVRAQPSQDLDIVSVEFFNSSPVVAAQVANEVAKAYQEVVAENRQANADSRVAALGKQRQTVAAKLAGLDQRIAQSRLDAQKAAVPAGPSLEQRLAADAGFQALQADHSITQSQLQAIDGRIEQIAVDTAASGSAVDLVEPAVPSSTPVRPQPKRDALLAAVLGLLAASAFVWWRSYRHQTVQVSTQPAGLVGMPLLAEISFDRDIKVHAGGADLSSSPAVAGYDFLVASLVAGQVRDRFKTLLVTSPREGDGKTATALNLAARLARHVPRVVLIDADLRTAGLTKLMPGESSPGLTGLGGNPSRAARLVVHPVNDSAGVGVLTAGELPADPASFLSPARLSAVLGAIGQKADLIIIDAPPVLAYPDALLMASAIDASLLVTTPGTPAEILELAAEALARCSARPLGYVFNHTFPDRGAPAATSRPHSSPPPAPNRDTDAGGLKSIRLRHRRGRAQADSATSQSGSS
jgi:polysaccharide biosynthesis transport protein